MLVFGPQYSLLCDVSMAQFDIVIVELSHLTDK